MSAEYDLQSKSVYKLLKAIPISSDQGTELQKKKKKKKWSWTNTTLPPITIRKSGIFDNCNASDI